MANLSNINIYGQHSGCPRRGSAGVCVSVQRTYGYFRGIVVKCIGAGSNTDDVMQNENETLERVQFGVSDEVPVYRLETQDIFDLINYEGVEEVLEEHNTELKALVTDATDEEGSLLTYEMWSIPDGSDTL